MKRNILHACATLGVSLLLVAPGVSAAKTQDNYTQRPEAQALIAELVEQGFSAAELEGVLDQAKQQKSILKAMSRPAEKRLTWGEYRKLFLTKKRISQGLKFWKENQQVLNKAEQEFGVPAEIIVAIIGIETSYGRITGNYRVVDALATLGFDYPRRAKFFREQLKEYFLLTRAEGVDPLTLKGSYAGAMGLGQFIPSSFNSYAIDFDGDNKKDIWNNPHDAIGSVANYFAKHGWKTGETVRVKAIAPATAEQNWFNDGLELKLSMAEWRARDFSSAAELDDAETVSLMRLEKDGEFQDWFGLHNFYVITRYNHSRLYASAVYELSAALNAKR
ncbi:lytic murein transglycosylase B [Aliamphritea ceti]|uniref:lytic murein transglycosylase B n=1 Tax=Aliamphritea ceti TaxID=1524258 RepID=UPI0021C3A906|nr:lytic murein transglycosylase B [Aliamphritea ceti]